MTETVPRESIILVAATKPSDYVDSFIATVRHAEHQSIDYLAATLFSSVPAWARALLAFGDWIASCFWAKHGSDGFSRQVLPDVRYHPGERIVYFRVSHRTEDEIVMAESDALLDFRTSVRKTPRGDGLTDVELTTVVWINSVWGRLYFAPVKPFHRFLMHRLMCSFAKRVSRENRAPTRTRSNES